MLEERVPYLNEEDDIIIEDIREENCRDVSEYDEDKKNIHSLSWGVYMKLIGIFCYKSE